MYDTIEFRLKFSDVPDVNFIEETPCYLDETTLGTHNYNSGVYVTGNVGSLKVTIRPDQIKVGGGSFCKWYLGDNYKTMTKGDVKMGIERLSDTLHLPMDKATITRIDVAQNIIVKYPINVYFDHLGNLGNAKRLQEPNGLYYSRSDGRLCFYDKNREQRDKREFVPDFYKGKKVLRYEQRYIKRLPKQFKVDEVRAALLYDESLYIALLQNWRDSYKKIQKINDVILKNETMIKAKTFNQMATLCWLKEIGGEAKALAKIAESQKMGYLNRRQAYDLRVKVENACKVTEGLTMQSDAIAELDKKINEVVENCLNTLY